MFTPAYLICTFVSHGNSILHCNSYVAINYTSSMNITSPLYMYILHLKHEYTWFTEFLVSQIYIIIQIDIKKLINKQFVYK